MHGGVVGPDPAGSALAAQACRLSSGGAIQQGALAIEAVFARPALILPGIRPKSPLQLVHLELPMNATTARATLAPTFTASTLTLTLLCAFALFGCNNKVSSSPEAAVATPEPAAAEAVAPAPTAAGDEGGAGDCDAYTKALCEVAGTQTGTCE